jgi:hypothetical protein
MASMPSAGMKTLVVGAQPGVAPPAPALEPAVA